MTPWLKKQKSCPHHRDSLSISSNDYKHASQARYDISIGMDMVIVTIREAGCKIMNASLSAAGRFVNRMPTTLPFRPNNWADQMEGICNLPNTLTMLDFDQSRSPVKVNMNAKQEKARRFAGTTVPKMTSKKKADAHG